MSEAPSAARVAEYLRLAEQMRAAADRAFDPAIAAAYLALSAKWVRLAEQAQRGVPVIDRTQPDPKPRDNHN
jgi:hypothetical protein